MGNQLQIFHLALDRKFFLIISSIITNEVKSNLTAKFKMDVSEVENILNKLIDIANIYEPSVTLNISRIKKILLF